MDSLTACCFFLNATLGEPQSDVVHRLGEITMRTAASGETVAEYALDRARAKEDITFKDGRVLTITIQQSGWTDEPSTLADLSGRDVRKNRGGAVWTYRRLNGRVAAISLGASNAVLGGLPAVAPVAPHGGTTFDDALINGALDEASSARNEENYLTTLRCNSGRDEWRELQQSLVQQNGHPYDSVKLACSSGPEVRDVYFDISSSFGKL